jgi:hypothetical protein
MKTSLLFGSGVSLYSGIPDLFRISDDLLNSNLYWKNDQIYIREGYFSFTKQNYLYCYSVRARRLIHLIKLEIDRFNEFVNNRHITNYEDIYYVIRQLDDCLKNEYENPAVLKLIDFLIKTMDISKQKLIEELKEAKVYIECVVWQSIDEKIEKFDQFNIIHELMKIFNIGSIFSLNHDLVLDKWLIANNIDVDDGFEQVDGLLPQWKGFVGNTQGLKLHKLHGSIDWFELSVCKPYRYEQVFKIPVKTYIGSIHLSNDSFLGATKDVPELLIGTFNKMFGYLSGVFEHLYDMFRENLKTTEILIISGYGFGDKGINTRLLHWISSPYSKKMIVIHPDKTKLISDSRGSFKINFLNERRKHPKFEIVEKKFEDVSLKDIQGCLIENVNPPTANYFII